MNTGMCKISIVVSVYNEQEVLGKFLKELQEAVSFVPEITPEYIFVNDGSTDNTGELLDNFVKKSKSARVIHFSTNFGHEAAMIAGIDHSSGDAVICMDSDLQHPPRINWNNDAQVSGWIRDRQYDTKREQAWRSHKRDCFKVVLQLVKQDFVREIRA
jgi:glycosyltransferase involved in cell wall biosynthesis